MFLQNNKNNANASKLFNFFIHVLLRKRRHTESRIVIVKYASVQTSIFSIFNRIRKDIFAFYDKLRLRLCQRDEKPYFLPQKYSQCSF